ncbi:response regulator transcription factor [Limisalsivibrio acetivorans]|uniref:response regulator transcription factor n=1 Tax=Limisalsivibrio acetivorans TaxID=1304888 RepID=UPI0003B3F480|nr:response regulator transcription factor [Limisalsivibrio acetivorans]
MRHYLVISNNTLHAEFLTELLIMQNHRCDTLKYDDYQGVEGYLNSYNPDFVILDIFSSNFNEHLLKTILESDDNAEAMLLTSRSNPFQKYYFKKYGVRNFVYIEDDVKEIAESLKGIRGKRKTALWPRSLDNLTIREYEVLQKIALGMTSKEIAEKLSISKNTVDTHRNKMLQKLKLSNSTALVNYALKSGLI